MALRVVCAPDSFKESMTAAEAAHALAAGVLRAAPDAECVAVPMADGGEGTTQALVDALAGEWVRTECSDALGRRRPTAYGLVRDDGIAVIEVAAACGLAGIAPQERDAARATSAGVGELIRHALDSGARRFLIGLGGSATNDAGAGMATALGAVFLDADGEPLPPGGAALARLARVDLAGLDARLAGCSIELACDVDNPLLGPSGASAVFGPQKGADPATVAELDGALRRWADIVEPAVGRTVRDLPGSGAAGGLGAAFLALTGAVPRRGVELVADAVGLADALVSADWVFTGEGRIDGQTRHGKTPWGVTLAARRAGVPVVLFAGQVDDTAADLLDEVVALVPIIRGPGGLGDALAQGRANLAAAAETVTRLLLAGPR
jgi:glycerate kinase